MNALVTGASTGIGKAIAVELGKKGYQVGLVARRRERLEEVRAEIKGAEIFVYDLSDVIQVNSLIQSVKAKYNHLDVMVNAAGVWHGESEVYAGRDLGEFDQKVIMDTYMVGFTTPTILIHGLLPIMGKGTVIMNISGTFENGAKGWLPYFASKRALEDFTLGLAEELGVKGIKVNCVSPSDTSTEEYQKYFPEDAKDANSPEQVARLVVDVVEKEATGKFWVIKKGQVGEGFHK